MRTARRSAMLRHARAAGDFLLRIEDLDQTRSRPEFVDGIYEDLRWLGLDWDEPVLIQSQRTAVYEAALETLRAAGLVYACFCTRADIAQSLTAPHGDAATSYPGTCRELADDPERRATAPHCWRLNSGKALAMTGLPSWRETDGKEFSGAARDIGDAILARKDAPASYHLSCVVDDAASGVTMVVRGADLRPSTPIQRLLQTLLGLPEPSYPAPPAGRARGRPPPRQARSRADARRDARVRRRWPRPRRQLLTGQLPSGFRFQEA